ncbi:MAG: hypothetical protein KF851_08175 [Pirellulaceae bacterium]|jgi:hypothetical protein|nr:hypothetical protein [Pirellulaceae bacterium]
MNIEPTASDTTVASSQESFVDRRVSGYERKSAGIERRQFSNSYRGLSSDAAELGRAIDAYKLERHRRFIDFEEMLAIIKSLGYSKST